MATTHSIEPFFFGPADSGLYGALHAPLTDQQRRWGVLLAYPLGQEYMRAHRTYVQIANRLTRNGFHCMRFDYFGCGDSAGAHEQARLARWLEDIGAAADELRRRTNCEAVCIAGMRAGASLAALAATRRDDVDCVVLWNPVVDGAQHLQELTAVQQHMIGHSYASGGPIEDGYSELLGYLFSRDLLDDLSGLDLAAATAAPARQVLLLDSIGDASAVALGQRYESLGATVQFSRVADSRIWLDEPFKAVVPGAIVQAISTQIAEAGA